MARQRRSFSTEFRREAASLVLDQGYSVAEACRSLDVGETALRRWAMKKALAETQLEESFTDHDLRTKVASDLDTDQQASDLMAHSSLQITRKHYRLKGQKVAPAPGFVMPRK